MTIGGSIFLIAVGAILKFAVTATVAGIDIQVVGVILMVAGAIGLVLGLFLMAQNSNRPPNDPYNQGPPPPPPPPPPQY
jgi:hypothetical protein